MPMIGTAYKPKLDVTLVGCGMIYIGFIIIVWVFVLGAFIYVMH